MIKLNNLSYYKNFSFLVCRHGQSIWNKENKFKAGLIYHSPKKVKWMHSI